MGNFEYIALAILAAFLVGFLLNLKRTDARARTAEEVWFANVRKPQFYEQRDPTEAAAMSAKAEWENAVKMLEQCGNKAIQKSDLHLWLWRTTENARVDFEAWQLHNAAQRVKFEQEFTAKKAANMKDNPAVNADYIWNLNEENQN